VLRGLGFFGKRRILFISVRIFYILNIMFTVSFLLGFISYLNYSRVSWSLLIASIYIEISCNMLKQSTTQYNVVHYSLPLFLFRSLSFTYLSYIHFNMVSEPDLSLSELFRRLHSSTFRLFPDFSGGFVVQLLASFRTFSVASLFNF
jgi:hypothetical protein